MSAEPTATAEEYLEAIHNMVSEDRPPIIARLAEQLGVAPPTVAGMLQRLSRDGFITISRNKEIQLTEKGREAAETMVRRHRLAERLLTDILGIEWHDAHDEACRFEHAISPKVEDRIFTVLGKPFSCPHGNPIPGTHPPSPKQALQLAHVQTGSRVVVERITEEAEREPKLLEYLGRNGIVPGATLSVVEVAPFNGTMTVESSGRTVVIGLQVASKIRVYAADEG